MEPRGETVGRRLGLFREQPRRWCARTSSTGLLRRALQVFIHQLLRHQTCHSLPNSPSTVQTVPRKQYFESQYIALIRSIKMFFKSLLVSALAALATAQSNPLGFTKVPNPVTVGKPNVITYMTNDDTTPVTILLRRGVSGPNMSQYCRTQLSADIQSRTPTTSRLSRLSPPPQRMDHTSGLQRTTLTTVLTTPSKSNNLAMSQTTTDLSRSRALPNLAPPHLALLAAMAP